MCYMHHLPFFQEKKASTVSVEVKKSQHKYVIGPKGNAINEILAETGVFVEMPASDSTSETITLRGPQEKLGLGKHYFNRLQVAKDTSSSFKRMTLSFLDLSRIFSVRVL